MSGPRWLHDCSRCVFLGHSPDGQEDLYFCRHLSGGFSLLGRFGDGPGEDIAYLIWPAGGLGRHPPDWYMQGQPGGLKALALAKKAGLLTAAECGG